MDINADLIKKIAKSSRLELTEDEISMFVNDFDSILKYFEILDGVDVTDEVMSIQPVQIKARLRPDEVKNSLSVKDALKNSKNTKDGYFMGPSAV